MNSTDEADALREGSRAWMKDMAGNFGRLADATHKPFLNALALARAGALDLDETRAFFDGLEKALIALNAIVTACIEELESLKTERRKANAS